MARVKRVIESLKSLNVKVLAHRTEKLLTTKDTKEKRTRRPQRVVIKSLSVLSVITS